MKETFTSDISYEKLIEIIKSYFKEVENLDVEFKGDLQDWRACIQNEVTAKFFVLNNVFGEVEFFLSSEDIEEILRWFLQKNNLVFNYVTFLETVYIDYKYDLKLNNFTIK